MRYLLDTDIAVDWLRGVERAKNRVMAAAEEGLAISYITLAELYEGVYLSTDQSASERELGELLFGLDFVPWTSSLRRSPTSTS